MLFFRSEESVGEWCRERAVVPGPIVPMLLLWRLSVRWYGNRLSPMARRPGPAEMRDLFASLGLIGPFWDPEAT